MPERMKFLNGKWLAQAASGTQRYATEVLRAVVSGDSAFPLTLVVPSDASIPDFAKDVPTLHSRFRGVLFEQLALPWISRHGHLVSLAGPAALLRRDQTVVMHDAMPFRYPSTFRWTFVIWYRLMYGILSRTVTRLFTVSRFSRTELATVLHLPEGRLGLAPCGADHVSPDEVCVENELPFPPGSYALLVGNLAPHKNTLAAVRELARAGLPVVVVGSTQSQVFRGVEMPEYQSVSFLGRVDEHRLRQLYAAAGVLVAPSLYEGFGIPVVEAGRLGCPSVVASGSAMVDVVGDGGEVFDRGDLTECVVTVRRYLDDHDFRAAAGERARTNASQYRWSATAAALMSAERPRGLSEQHTEHEVDDFSSERVRVLHVTETFSAGTGSAMVGFAEATADQGIDSLLLAQDRGSGLLDTLLHPPFVSATVVRPGVRQLWRALPSAVREERPDLIHVHSSIAGVIVRLRLGFRRTVPLVYSPHCFAFERRDVPGWQQRVFRVVEQLLARGTAAFVCVSPHEAALAAGLCGRVPIVSLVNVFDPVEELPPATTGPPGTDLGRIVCVGRISPQKDPSMFADIVSALDTESNGSAGTWIGAGDDATGLRALEEAGIVVTGWLAAPEIADALAGSSVYVHTASWEAGPPIAVLDAMRAALPVVLRRNDAYRGVLPAEWQFDDVGGAVHMIRGLREAGPRGARIEEQWRILHELAARSPRAVLAQAYRDVRAGSPRGGPRSHTASGICMPPRVEDE